MKEKPATFHIPVGEFLTVRQTDAGYKKVSTGVCHGFQTVTEQEHCYDDDEYDMVISFLPSQKKRTVEALTTYFSQATPIDEGDGREIFEGTLFFMKASLLAVNNDLDQFLKLTESLLSIQETLPWSEKTDEIVQVIYDVVDILKGNYE